MPVNIDSLVDEGIPQYHESGSLYCTDVWLETGTFPLTFDPSRICARAQFPKI